MAQKKIILSGESRVSVLDVGLGAAAGLAVPYGARYALAMYAPADMVWLREWSGELGAVAGMGASVALGAWRGMAPAVIGFVLSALFGAGSLIERFLLVPSAAAQVPAGDVRGLAGNLGLLTAKPAEQFGSAGHLTVERPSSLAGAMAGANLGVFGQPSFGSVPWAG